MHQQLSQPQLSDQLDCILGLVADEQQQAGDGRQVPWFTLVLCSALAHTATEDARGDVSDLAGVKQQLDGLGLCL